MSKYGNLHLIIGPMFASKTTHGASIFSSLTSFDGINGVYVTHSIDKGEGRREMECGTTHNPMLEINGCDKISTPTLSDLDVSNYSIIFLDEAQFFGEEIVEVVNTWLNQNKNIIVSGLVSDSNGNPFGHMAKLLHMADDIDYLKAYCSECQKEGIYNRCSFTSCILNFEGQVGVGGKNIYYPSCRKHRF